MPSGFGLNPVPTTETFQQKAVRSSHGKGTRPRPTFPVKTALFSPPPSPIVPRRYNENGRLLGFL